MADKARPVIRRNKKKDNEPAEIKKEVKNGGNKDETDASAAEAVAPNGAGQNGQDGDFQVEPMELPPFEIITGYVSFTCFLNYATILSVYERICSTLAMGVTTPRLRNSTSQMFRQYSTTSIADT